MSRQSLNQTLQSLLASASTISPVLLDLAVALYAQSRSKVPYLKPEEEVARECVCCVLAAERLKHRLNLPTITPRPPCPPKVYKKLHQYLDSTLQTTRNQSSRSAAPSNPTIAKPAGPRILDTSHLPSWVPSTITHVCKRLQRPELDKTILAGIAYLTHRSQSRTKSASFDSLYDPLDKHVPALIVAVAWFVIGKSTPDLNPDMRTKTMSLAVEDLISLRKVAVTKSGLCESQANGMLDDLSDSWTQMPWCSAIQPNLDPTLRDVATTHIPAQPSPQQVSHPPPPLLDDDGEMRLPGDEWPSDDEMQDALETQELKSAKSQDLPQQKVEIPAESSTKSFDSTFTGSMRQPRVDWLSPEKSADYETWRALTLQRIAAAVQA